MLGSATDLVAIPGGIERAFRFGYVSADGDVMAGHIGDCEPCSGQPGLYSCHLTSGWPEERMGLSRREVSVEKRIARIRNRACVGGQALRFCPAR